jgi:3-hydroxybutyryl-CoA dehydrogenase
MTGLVIGSRDHREQFPAIFDKTDIEVRWIDSTQEWKAPPPDFILDLHFLPGRANTRQETQTRIDALSRIPSPLIFLNAVAPTLKSLGVDERFVRINAWNTFLERPLAEVVVDPSSLPLVGHFFSVWGKSFEALTDVPGMPSARIVSMIINEAFFAWGEEVSTREAIDTAMKLGTNYPFGPFEWSTRIGLAPVYDLLETLYEENPRYTIAPLLHQGVAF